MTRLRQLHFLLALFVVGCGGIAWPVFAQTYLTPDGTAPGANFVPVAPPLNSSSTIQHKAGSLLIGPNGGSAKLCLNANADTDTSGRCIDSWDDVSNSIGGPFLHYDATTVYTVANGKLPASYTAQPGFARVNATCSAANCPAGSVQLYSYLTAAPTGNNQAGSPITGAYGLYATDGGSAANYAGYFSGTLHIHQTIPGPALGQICLNGLIANTECIDQWTDVSSGGGAYLQLQGLNTTPVPNTGSISISGTGIFGSVVVDSPNATMSRTATCGDGMCTTVNGETFINCAIDCAPLATLTAASVTPNTGAHYCSGDQTTTCFSQTTCSNAGKGTCQTYTGNVSVSTPNSQLPAGSQVNVIVVRAKDAAPTFVPLQGSTYTAGLVYGDSTIVYAGKLNQGLVDAIVGHDRVTSSGTYYYRAYLGNLYPRYGAPYTPSVNAQVTYVSLLVAKNTNGGAPGSESPDSQIICGTGTSAYCIGYYRTGTTVSLSADAINAGYTWRGWTGCIEPYSASTTQCTVTVNQNTVVTADYSGGGSGPGGGPVFGN